MVRDFKRDNYYFETGSTKRRRRPLPTVIAGVLKLKIPENPELLLLGPHQYHALEILPSNLAGLAVAQLVEALRY